MSEQGDTYLSEIFSQIMRRWRRLVLGGAIGLFLGYFMGYLTEPVYVATLVVAENTEKLDRTLANQDAFGRFGLSRLTGLDSDGGEAALFFQVLRSLPAAEELWRHDDIVAKLFPKRWSEENGKWLPAYGNLTQKLMQFLLAKPDPSTAKPSPWEIIRFLQRNVHVIFMNKEGYWRVEFRNINREVALEVLDVSSSYADNYLRLIRARQLSKQKEHLLEQLTTVKIQDYRAVLINILEEVDYKILLSIPGQPFVVRIIEGPHAALVPERRFFSLIVLAGFLIGVVGSLVTTQWNLIRQFRKQLH